MSASDKREPAQWEVPVLDAVNGAPHVLVVKAVGGSLVFVPPTAAGYVVPAEHIRRLREAIDAAESVAAAQRRGYRPQGA